MRIIGRAHCVLFAISVAAIPAAAEEDWDGWLFEKYQHPLTDATSYWAGARSEDGEALAILTCLSDGRVDFAVSGRAFIDPSRAYNTQIYWRDDTGQVVLSVFDPTEEGALTTSPSIILRLTEAISAAKDRFVMQSKGGPKPAVFPVKDASTAIGKFLDACKLTP